MLYTNISKSFQYFVYHVKQNYGEIIIEKILDYNSPYRKKLYQKQVDFNSKELLVFQSKCTIFGTEHFNDVFVYVSSD